MPINTTKKPIGTVTIMAQRPAPPLFGSLSFHIFEPAAVVNIATNKGNIAKMEPQPIRVLPDLTVLTGFPCVGVPAGES